MKTVLDLIGEYAKLNDAKIRQGGILAPQDEQRWQELKSFYDLLMSHAGLAGRTAERWLSTTDVLDRIKARERLRVPLEREFIFKVDGEFHAGFAVNMSRGGIYVSSTYLVPVGTRVTLFLAQNDERREALLETPGVVAWLSARETSNAFLPPGMGIRFVDKRDNVENLLDGMLVDALVRHLSGLGVESLAPQFFLSEKVEL